MIVYTCVLHDVFERGPGQVHAPPAAPFLCDKVIVARQRWYRHSSLCNEHYKNIAVRWPPTENVSCVTFMPAPRL